VRWVETLALALAVVLAPVAAWAGGARAFGGAPKGVVTSPRHHFRADAHRHPHRQHHPDRRHDLHRHRHHPRGVIIGSPVFF